MTFVHEQTRPAPDITTGATDRAPLTWQEMENLRQSERDNGALLLGILAVVAVILGALALLALGGPKPEDPLPVPTATTAAPWETCDVTGLHIVCHDPNGQTMDVTVASQSALDHLCGALPCKVHSAGIAGNGNCDPECLRERGVID